MDAIKFKYRAVDANGRECGFRASRGELNDDALILDKSVIPLAAIYQTVHRHNRLALIYAGQQGQVVYTIAPYGGVVDKLKRTIDRICSYRWADERYAALEREGKGAAFRSAKCPSCMALVDLTGFADTPQFYCPFCEKLQSADPEIEYRDDAYRLCDRCRFYCKPTRYTTTYIILNVISWQEHSACHVCMRRECWKMMLINLLPPFIGVAFAVGHTIRAYGAGMMDSYLPELVRANACAAKGKIEQAQSLYDTMLDRVRVHAGLRYNIALAHSRRNAWEECLAAAEDALADCSNYTPAGTLLSQALVQLGRQDESEKFLRSWGVPQVAAVQQTSGRSDQITRRRPLSADEHIQDA